MMKGAIVRRVLTGIPSSAWLTPNPSFQNFKILATSGKGSYRSYARRALFVPPTYDELPVPRGSWQTQNEKDNHKYNKHLGLGVSFFLFTIMVVSRVATFNFSPPPLDGPLGGSDDDLCVPPEEKQCK